MVSVRVPIVEHRDASYDILIGRGLLRELPALAARLCPAARYAIVSDSHVAKLCGERTRAAFQGSAELFSFPAGEWNKTRETWSGLSDRMLTAGFGRDAAVIALGGGVVGDIAGFVAATYLRGVPYLQAPTSLLAMIDSSIGGKTGVDVPAGKNQVGAFHQPRAVVADLECLETLTPVQLASGMAEAIKHGVIADPAYFELLGREHQAVLKKDLQVLEQVVVRSVEIKAAVVSEDEREAGRRAVLNFGHTIGHAIEATSGYEILHGEAVGLGMVYEARLAQQLGLASAEVERRISTVLAHYGLPRERPDKAVGDLLGAMRHDKKNRDGAIHFSLPRDIGTMVGDAGKGWTLPVAEEQVRALLEATAAA